MDRECASDTCPGATYTSALGWWMAAGTFCVSAFSCVYLLIQSDETCVILLPLPLPLSPSPRDYPLRNPNPFHPPTAGCYRRSAVSRCLVWPIVYHGSLFDPLPTASAGNTHTYILTQECTCSSMLLCSNLYLHVVFVAYLSTVTDARKIILCCRLVTNLLLS